ncbi:MAG: hypothetical protein HY690_11065 [Chloroflexi bacterium]|nr:hypothetical protein [Chloroflexota bacterium]
MALDRWTLRSTLVALALLSLLPTAWEPSAWASASAAGAPVAPPRSPGLETRTPPLARLASALPTAEAWAWGANATGQLGDGTTSPHPVAARVAALGGAVAVAAGDGHSLALQPDGTVWSWGDNRSGQLGDGTTTNRATPVQVQGLSGVTAIAAGSAHSLALGADGKVWAWGDNSTG